MNRNRVETAAASALSTPLISRLAAFLLAAGLGAVLLAGCGGGGSPTSPYGGGGNGGTTGGGGTGGSLFSFGPFALSQSAQMTFATAGSIGYHCIAHQAMGMVGTVQVDATGADSMLVLIGGSGFSFAPATAHIKPGGYVRWVNASSLTNHTVTSN
jgi:hypothetical protein